MERLNHGNNSLSNGSNALRENPRRRQEIDKIDSIMKVPDVRENFSAISSAFDRWGVKAIDFFRARDAQGKTLEDRYLERYKMRLEDETVPFYFPIAIRERILNPIEQLLASSKNQTGEVAEDVKVFLEKNKTDIFATLNFLMQGAGLQADITITRLTTNLKELIDRRNMPPEARRARVENEFALYQAEEKLSKAHAELTEAVATPEGRDLLYKPFNAEMGVRSGNLLKLSAVAEAELAVLEARLKLSEGENLALRAEEKTLRSKILKYEMLQNDLEANVAFNKFLKAEALTETEKNVLAGIFNLELDALLDNDTEISQKLKLLKNKPNTSSEIVNLVFLKKLNLAKIESLKVNFSLAGIEFNLGGRKFTDGKEFLKGQVVEGLFSTFSELMPEVFSEEVQVRLENKFTESAGLYDVEFGLRSLNDSFNNYLENSVKVENILQKMANSEADILDRGKYESVLKCGRDSLQILGTNLISVRDKTLNAKTKIDAILGQTDKNDPAYKFLKSKSAELQNYLETALSESEIRKIEKAKVLFEQNVSAKNLSLALASAKEVGSVALVIGSAVLGGVSGAVLASTVSRSLALGGFTSGVLGTFSASALATPMQEIGLIASDYLGLSQHNKTPSFAYFDAMRMSENFLMNFGISSAGSLTALGLTKGFTSLGRLNGRVAAFGNFGLRVLEDGSRFVNLGEQTSGNLLRILRHEWGGELWQEGWERICKDIPGIEFLVATFSSGRIKTSGNSLYYSGDLNSFQENFSAQFKKANPGLDPSACFTFRENEGGVLTINLKGNDGKIYSLTLLPARELSMEEEISMLGKITVNKLGELEITDVESFYETSGYLIDQGFILSENEGNLFVFSCGELKVRLRVEDGIQIDYKSFTNLKESLNRFSYELSRLFAKLNELVNIPHLTEADLASLRRISASLIGVLTLLTPNVAHAGMIINFDNMAYLLTNFLSLTVNSIPFLFPVFVAILMGQQLWRAGDFVAGILKSIELSYKPEYLKLAKMLQAYKLPNGFDLDGHPPNNIESWVRRHGPNLAKQLQKAGYFVKNDKIQELRGLIKQINSAGSVADFQGNHNLLDQLDKVIKDIKPINNILESLWCIKDRYKLMILVVVGILIDHFWGIASSGNNNESSSEQLPATAETSDVPQEYYTYRKNVVDYLNKNNCPELAEKLKDLQGDNAKLAILINLYRTTKLPATSRDATSRHIEYVKSEIAKLLQ